MVSGFLYLLLYTLHAGHEAGTRLRVEGASLLASRVLLMHAAAHAEEISTAQVALLVVTCCGGMFW